MLDTMVDFGTPYKMADDYFDFRKDINMIHFTLLVML